MISLLYSYSKAYTITCPYSEEELYKRLGKLNPELKGGFPSRSYFVGYCQTSEKTFEIDQSFYFNEGGIGELIATGYGEVKNTTDTETELYIDYRLDAGPLKMILLLMICFLSFVISLVIYSVINNQEEHLNEHTILVLLPCLMLLILIGALFYLKSYISILHGRVMRTLKK